jgi:hypothetical protein
MAFQGLTATKAAHWVSLGLLGLVVVLCFAWPQIWVEAVVKKRLAFGAPAWTIAAMLLVAAPGLTLVPSTTVAALWAPLVAWLIVALGLCLQAQSQERLPIHPQI